MRRDVSPRPGRALSWKFESNNLREQCHCRAGMEAGLDLPITQGCCNAHGHRISGGAESHSRHLLAATRSSQYCT
ncbi:hypothetical protein EVAR_31845_1 [Eumeta japonica]|uniref:Uncharacterized protein n=1 Tax=Eumeta variegata TaxID=151549 RepID=A0A4C1WJU9_EUMVA|nr:hypothetical protein EVAR_31845_1 [Eumeta japonica]